MENVEKRKEIEICGKRERGEEERKEERKKEIKILTRTVFNLPVKT